MSKITFINRIKYFCGYVFYRLPDRAENLFSHWYYQSRIKGHTESLHIRGKARIQWPKRLEVGENCCINDGCLMQCQAGVTLGDNVTISTGAIVLSRQYQMSNWVEQCTRNEPEMEHEEKAVFLNDHTWVCAGAIIMPGVSIRGKGVVIGAGTIVNKDIEDDYVLVAGAPARIVKKYIQK